MKQTKKTFSFSKYLIVLLGGIMLSAVVVFADTTITTNVNNAVQYIQKLVLTDNGGADGTTGVIIDGNDPFKLQVYGDSYFSGGILGQDFVGDTIQGITGKFLSYCNYSGSLCKTLEELFTNDNYYTKTEIDDMGYITGAALDGYITGAALDGYITGAALDGYITGYTDLWSTGTAGKIYYTGGNVGIGTTTPAYTLDVNGIGYFTGIYISDDDGTKFHKIINSGNDLYIKAGHYTYDIIFDNFDHIGIGTSTPAYTLDVNGTGNFGFLQSDSGIKIGATGSTGCALSQAGTIKYMNIDGGSALKICMRTNYMEEGVSTYDRVDIVVATGGILQEGEVGIIF